jgi:DivIVA domain-containing protein
MSKEERRPEARPSTAAAKIVTPLEIQQKEFRVSRFGGYKMREVDEFLDELTESVGALIAENEQLRRRLAEGPHGAPDLQEVSRQADEMIRRAREEASRIVNEASERAAAIAAGSSSADPTVAGADPSAVDAFLAQERRFLQGLAALVQEHAQTVKAMAREARRARASGSAEQPPPPEPAAEDAPDAPEPTVAMDEPIVVEEPEPEPSRARGERRERDGDPTLRELFWGEGS